MKVTSIKRHYPKKDPQKARRTAAQDQKKAIFNFCRCEFKNILLGYIYISGALVSLSQKKLQCVYSSQGTDAAATFCASMQHQTVDTNTTSESSACFNAGFCLRQVKYRVSPYLDSL